MLYGKERHTKGDDSLPQTLSTRGKNSRLFQSAFLQMPDAQGGKALVPSTSERLVSSMAWGGKGSLGEVGYRWRGARRAAEVTDITTKTSLSTEKEEVRRWGV